MIEFTPLTAEDLPLLCEWLNRPHVAQWWDRATSFPEVQAKFLPRIAGGPVRPYIAWLGGRRVGFVESYRAAECGGGWWPDEHDHGVMGIDLFLAEFDSLGRGLGSEMTRQFAGFLLCDPTVTRIQADPAPNNAHAIRCFEKAGFRRIGGVVTPEGPALLMILAREEHDAAAPSGV